MRFFGQFESHEIGQFHLSDALFSVVIHSSVNLAIVACNGFKVLVLE
jgi:hypothetical protein